MPTLFTCSDYIHHVLPSSGAQQRIKELKQGEVDLQEIMQTQEKNLRREIFGLQHENAMLEDKLRVHERKHERKFCKHFGSFFDDYTVFSVVKISS